MQFVDNFIILMLIALAFWMGKRISDSYYQKVISELEFQLRLRAAEKGVGYVAPPAPVRKYMPIGQPFMDRLKKDGRAVTKFKQSDLQR